MIALLCILGAIVLLLITRLSFMAQYGEEGVLLRARIGPFGLTVYPRPEKKPKKKKEKKKKEKEETEPKVSQKGGSVAMFKAGLSMVGPILERVRRRLVIREITLHYTAAMEDAAMTALAYGGAHAAVSKILPRLRHHFRVKKQDVRILADFESEEDLIFLRIRLSITVWGVLCLGLFSLREMKRSGLWALIRKRGKSTPLETKTPAAASSS